MSHDPDPTPVRRAAARVVRRSRRTRRRAAVPRERHPRARRSRPSGWPRSASTTSPSAASARSTARTARCWPRSEPTSPRTASTCRSTGATATGTRTSPARCGRCATTAYDGRSRSSPPRTPRTPAAASTARTWRPPRPRWAPARPRIDKLRHYFNHPGFVDTMIDHDGRRARRSCRPMSGRAPTWRSSRTRSRRRWRRRAARAAARTRRSISRPPAWSPTASARAGAGDLPWELVYCSRSGPPHAAVARAGRERPPRAAGRRRRARRSSWCRSGSCPTTWRSSTTSTPRRRRPRHGSGCRSPARPPPGRIRGSSRWSATSCSSGPRSSAAEPVERAVRRRARTEPRRVPGRLLPATCAARSPRSPARTSAERRPTGSRCRSERRP